MIHKIRKYKKIIVDIFIKKKRYYWKEKNNFFIDSKNIINSEFIKWALKQKYSNNLPVNIFIYEKFQTEIFLKYINKAKTFVDIGCQIGFYSLIANEYKNVKNILAIDISNECVDATKLNFKNNFRKNKNVVVKNQAIGSDTIKYSFWAEKAISKGDTLLNIVIKNNLVLSKNDLIKIDIEGFEYTYFNTIKEFLKINKPTIFFSLHKNFIKKLSNDSINLFNILDDLLELYQNVLYISDHTSVQYRLKYSHELPADDDNPVILCYEN